MKDSKPAIVYMGTPEFAVAPLKRMIEKGYPVKAVVTVPDKPAGRGKKLMASAVKLFALEHKIPVLQPEKLKNEAFLKELNSYNADVFVVVAFRMLPKEVWAMPNQGTFNLHASLLPQYRGAAPINHAIINGETKTGVTTFFIDEKIDTGAIILQKEVDIAPDENVGTLHDKLMETGAEAVIETLRQIKNNRIELITQDTIIHERNIKELKPAPKIFKDDCLINWHKPAAFVHNFVRGLSPYPAAFSFLKNNEENTLIKVYGGKPEPSNHNHKTGIVVTDNKSYLKISVEDGYYHILELQPAGKKRMQISAFLNGYKLSEGSFMASQ